MTVMSVNYSKPLMISESPTTPSLSTRPTMGPTNGHGRTPATTQFRSEKDTNWEGAFRVPAMIRWPGRIKAGKSRTTSFRASTGSPRCSRLRAIQISRNVSSMTRMSAARPSKVHLDGYNQLPYLTGQQPKSCSHRVLLFQR
jgi:arylsulfatase